MAKRPDLSATEAELEAVRRAINERFEREKAKINKRIEKQLAEVNGGLTHRQEAIVAAALELLSNYGLSDLSLRDIAKKMDIRAPALYWYFKNKADLVDHMAEAILIKEFANSTPRADSERWQDWLMREMKTLRKAMLAYPDGGRVVAGAHIYPTKTLGSLFENAQLSLTTAGFSEQDALYTSMTAVQFTFGFVIEEQSGPGEAGIPEDIAEKFKESFPNMASAGIKFQKNKNGRNEAFEFGLALIIKGAEGLA